LLVRFALLDRTVAIEDVLRTLGDRGSSGRPRPGGEPPHAGAAPPRAGSRGSAPDDKPRPAAGNPGTGADRPAPPPPVVRDVTPPRAQAQTGATMQGGVATRARTATQVRVTPAPIAGVPSINVVTERWDDVVAAVRANRMVLAPFLETAIPSAMTAGGVLTVRAEDAPSAEALELAMGDLVAIVNNVFPGVERIVVTRPEGASAAPRRVTEDEMRAQRMASLRKRDPVLGAAIDALDLELLE